MATTNLGLETINSSDYISPDPINNNMAKLDKLGVDYVVERGTSGEWWYRKWNSGRAECGIDNKQFGSSSLSAIGGSGTTGYGSSQYTFGAYPFNFASRPFTIISFQGDKQWSGRGSYISMGHSTSTSVSPNFFVVDFNPGTIEPMAGIYVSGRWK
jgi:hypothetical protein